LVISTIVLNAGKFLAPIGVAVSFLKCEGVSSLTYIPRKTFLAIEEKIASYFNRIKKVPSSSALSSSSGYSKRKRGFDDEKTPRRSPNKYQ
ncbi:unnamed protein product, partial [Ilex paraguariensis]